MNWIKWIAVAVVGSSLGASGLVAPAQAAETRVRVSGEVVDTWCSVTGIMFAYGTAHHQCAVWCALGGIPVSIKDKDGNFYMVLRIEEEEVNVANPRLVRINSHEVNVDGDLIERDGVKYLFVTKVADDRGIINMTQDEYGIQPFGN